MDINEAMLQLRKSCRVEKDFEAERVIRSYIKEVQKPSHNSAMQKCSCVVTVRTVLVSYSKCATCGGFISGTSAPTANNNDGDEIPDTIQYQCVNCGEHFGRLEHAKLHSGGCR
jgi:enamine deaminase RidA (YjgF/YER057c/UK114 family)